MRLYKLMCVFILASGTLKAERYFESKSTTWRNITCNLAEPPVKYNNGLFEINETLKITDDVWIGYLYAKVPFLLLGCASVPSENGSHVKEFGDCFTICRGGTFGIKRPRDGLSVFLCICFLGYLDAKESNCNGGIATSVCNNCYEIYTQTNVSASNVGDPGNKPEGDCLTYFHPKLRWQLCSRSDHIRAMCSNATFTDLNPTTIIDDKTEGEWSAGNKVCLKHGRHPSFERSITNTVFGSSQTQYYWTGIFRANILIQVTVKDYFTRFSNDSHVFANRSNMILWVANNDDIRKALCVKGTESTSRPQETSKYTTEGMPVITKSTYSESSVFLTKVTSPDDTTTVIVSTTPMYTIEASDYAFPTRSPALGIGIGVSVGTLSVVGGAVVIIVLKRRGIFNCNRKTKIDKPSEDETAFKNITYEKSIEDNVAQHNYFILEKCERSISNNVGNCNEPNETKLDDDYTTIQETEGPYEHVKEDICNYNHTTDTLKPGSHTRKPENVYNKLKIDRTEDNGHVQRQGLIQISEDDYDTTSAVLTHGKDDVSDYNHVPPAAYKEGSTGDDIKGDTVGDYDAITDMTFKVAQSHDSYYAHVNKH